MTAVSNRKARPDEREYTNLLILRRTKAGAFNIIDTAAPESSPLVQYALPAKDAQMPNPPVKSKPGARLPIFTGTSDKLYLKCIEWINTIYRDPYPVEYTPAAGGPQEKAPAPEAAGDGS